GPSAGEAGSVQCLGSGSAVGAGDGRVALPAGGCSGEEAFRRGEAAGGAVPAFTTEAGHLAPGRADESPRRRKRAMAGAASFPIRGNGDRRNPRPVFSGQCRRLDPGARSRAGDSLQRELYELAGTEEKAASDRGENRDGAAEG